MIYISGRIQKADSLFKYLDGASFESVNEGNFTPVFEEEVLGNMTTEEKEHAKTICGEGNSECIFDLAVTGEDGPSFGRALTWLL